MAKQIKTRTKAEIVSGLRGRQIERSAKADTTLIDKESKKVPFVIISKENAGRRYDWWKDEEYIEELDVSGAKYSELKTFFKDHEPSVDNAIGRVENARVEDGELKVDVIFGSDDNSYQVFRKYLDGILTDVSIGYSINDVITTERKGEPTHVLVTDFEIVELSAVWKGFDKGATVGRQAENIPEAKEQETFDERSIDILKKQLELKEKLS